MIYHPFYNYITPHLEVGDHIEHSGFPVFLGHILMRLKRLHDQAEMTFRFFDLRVKLVNSDQRDAWQILYMIEARP